MAHGGHQPDPAELDAQFAGVIAETMQALAAPSRVRILGRLHAGACSVNELAESVDMAPSAGSAQPPARWPPPGARCRPYRRPVVFPTFTPHRGEAYLLDIAHVQAVRAGV